MAALMSECLVDLVRHGFEDQLINMLSAVCVLDDLSHADLREIVHSIWNDAPFTVYAERLRALDIKESLSDSLDQIVQIAKSREMGAKGIWTVLQDVYMGRMLDPGRSLSDLLSPGKATVPLSTRS